MSGVHAIFCYNLHNIFRSPVLHVISSLTAHVSVQLLVCLYFFLDLSGISAVFARVASGGDKETDGEERAGILWIQLVPHTRTGVIVCLKSHRMVIVFHVYIVFKCSCCYFFCFFWQVFTS